MEATERPWEHVEIAPDDRKWGACEIWGPDGIGPVATMVCGVANASLIVRAVNQHDALLKCAEALRKLMKAASVHEVSDSAKAGENYDKAMDEGFHALSLLEKTNG